MKIFLMYSALILGLSGVLFFKSFLVYGMEKSLTKLLETPVKIKKLKLSSLELYGSIKEDSNNAYIKINSLYPLQADVRYKGNADAFKVYEPLKADAELKGSVYYKDTLVVKAELLALGTKSVIEIKSFSDDLEVLVDIKDLNLSKLQDENNISTPMAGIVDSTVNYHTDKDSVIIITSSKINIFGESFEDVELHLSEVENNLYSWAMFKAKAFDYKGIWFNYDEQNKSFDGEVDLRYKDINKDIKFRIEGEHNSSILTSQVTVAVAESKINIKNIVYGIDTHDITANIGINLRKLQTNTFLHQILGQKLYGDIKADANFEYKNKTIKADCYTTSLGGALKLVYENKILRWKAYDVDLSKVVKLLDLKQKIESKLITQGSFQEGHLKAHLKTDKLVIQNSEIKDINFTAMGDLKDLNITLCLVSEYATVKSSHLRIKNFDTLTLAAKLTTAYTKDEITLFSNSSLEKKTADLKAESSEFKLNIFKTYYAKEKLSGNYTTVIYPRLSGLEEKLSVKGDFSHKDVFSLLAKTEDLGGMAKVLIQGDKLFINASKLDVQKLLHTLKQPIYADGRLDIQAKGSFHKLAFAFKSKDIHLNKELTTVDENLSFMMKGEIDKHSLSFSPQIKNRFIQTSLGDFRYFFKKKQLNAKLPIYLNNKGKSRELLVQADINFNKNIGANIFIKHKWDDVSFKNIRYEDKKLSLDIDLDIDDLSQYQEFSTQAFYGPLKLKGKLSKKDKINLLLSTSSFGGKLQVRLKDKDLHIDMHKIQVIKVDHLLKEKASSQSGFINGTVEYNLKNKEGETHLRAENIEIKGIDIDKSLKELKDALGLNIFAMGDSLIKKRFLNKDDANLTTKIKEIVFDIDITPELIRSNDVALSTKFSRFAVDMDLKLNGDIKDFEVAILDYQGCAIIKQKLKGNIQNPQLVNSTGSAVLVLGKAPKEILNTGGKIISAGAGLIDSTASFIWKQGLRQNSEVTLIEDTLQTGGNIFSSGKDLIVRGKCKVFYSGVVKPPF